MLLSSSNRKYPPFQFLSYFSVVVCLRCFVTTNSVTYSIYIPGKSGTWCHYYCAVYDECKWSDTFCLENRIRAKLPEDIRPIKCMSDNFCRVCTIKHILSVIHYTICGDVCFQFSHFPCDYWENIYIYISDVWTITPCLGLGYEIMVCAVCRSIFLLRILTSNIRSREFCLQLTGHLEMICIIFSLLQMDGLITNIKQ